jgi:hypothetical protein
VDRHCATRPEAVLARLVSDYGDPLRPRYEHVDYESTCVDCSKHATRPWSYVMATERHLRSLPKDFQGTLLTY